MKNFISLTMILIGIFTSVYGAEKIDISFWDTGDTNKVEWYGLSQDGTGSSLLTFGGTKIAGLFIPNVEDVIVNPCYDSEMLHEYIPGVGDHAKHFNNFILLGLYNNGSGFTIHESGAVKDRKGKFESIEDFVTFLRICKNANRNIEKQLLEIYRSL